MNNSKHAYATVVDDEGVNYRDIAMTMSNMGMRMNHSSARNHVLRVMKIFASKIAAASGKTLSDTQLNNVSKSPLFQSGVADLLQVVEMKRRDELVKIQQR